ADPRLQQRGADLVRFLGSDAAQDRDHRARREPFAQRFHAAALALKLVAMRCRPIAAASGSSRVASRPTAANARTYRSPSGGSATTCTRALAGIARASWPI